MQFTVQHMSVHDTMCSLLSVAAVLIIVSLFCSGFPPFPSPTQPSVLLGEDPPPYSPLTSPESGSAPVISCRVCQSLISVEGKIHQHVVKCGVCNEATVTDLFLHCTTHIVFCLKLHTQVSHKALCGIWPVTDIIAEHNYWIFHHGP